MHQAYAISLPKSDNDPSPWDLYRPISLLQTNIQMIVKAVFLYLNKVIMALNHPCQTGFISGKTLPLTL